MFESLHLYIAITNADRPPHCEETQVMWKFCRCSRDTPAYFWLAAILNFVKMLAAESSSKMLSYPQLSSTVGPGGDKFQKSVSKGLFGRAPSF